MFADDTTLCKSGIELRKLIDDFDEDVKPLIELCKFNRLDINLSTTFCMFVTNMRVTLPHEVVIDGISVKVVPEFMKVLIAGSYP